MPTILDALRFMFRHYRTSFLFLVSYWLQLNVKENPNWKDQIIMVINYTNFAISCIDFYMKYLDQTLYSIIIYTRNHSKFRLNQKSAELLVYLSAIPLDYIIKYHVFMALDNLYGWNLELGYLFLAWGFGAFLFLPEIDRKPYYHEGLMHANSFSMVVGMYSVKIGYRLLVDNTIFRV